VGNAFVFSKQSWWHKELCSRRSRIGQESGGDESCLRTVEGTGE
jgi:hypothetical protein